MGGSGSRLSNWLTGIPHRASVPAQRMSPSHNSSLVRTNSPKSSVEFSPAAFALVGQTVATGSVGIVRLGRNADDRMEAPIPLRRNAVRRSAPTIPVCRNPSDSSVATISPEGTASRSPVSPISIRWNGSNSPVLPLRLQKSATYSPIRPSFSGENPSFSSRTPKNAKNRFATEN